MNYKQDTNLEFLKNKINEIKIALFKPESDFELQLPNNIVQTLRVEDDGTVWFFTTCNGYHARFMYKPFYAYLNYYNKNKGYRLQLSGKAIVVNDTNSFVDINDSKEQYTSVLVKMKIMKAEFDESIIPGDDITWPEKIKSVISNLFLSPAHRVYNF